MFSKILALLFQLYEMRRSKPGNSLNPFDRSATLLYRNLCTASSRKANVDPDQADTCNNSFINSSVFHPSLQ